MRVVMFYHSLVSDWNHGNAHFLRGIAGELIERGHEVDIWEPQGGWSLKNLVAEHGQTPVHEFHRFYPRLHSRFYEPGTFDAGRALEGADLVIVHEWSDPELVRRIGEHRARHGGYRLLFHDTHHRAVSDAVRFFAYDLAQYDGVLAFGGVLRDLYMRRGWTGRVWTWHEAADTRVFHPISGAPAEGDLVWIGNWGDDERTAELQEFLIEPVRRLGLRACAYGVRYPERARAALAAAGIEYRGWLPNYRVPETFARFRVTLHIPRRPYVTALPGIPTIRVFEALACGMPLLCAPWEDSESLFRAGRDYLVARDGAEMARLLATVLADERLARDLALRGRRAIVERHTCSHRVDELLAIVGRMHGLSRRVPA